MELFCDISRAFRIRLLSFALCFVRTEADVDGDGTINYAEFVMATMHRHWVEKNENLMRAFQYFYQDTMDDLITRDELEAPMKDYGVVADETVIKDILNEVDTDH
ncbi:hypothetical protein Droror1_Dr00027583, partial [Drosera rotundifolia]